MILRYTAPVFRDKLRPALGLLLAIIALASHATAQETTEASDADSAWSSLMERARPSPGEPPPAPPDWAAIARDADDFQSNFPADARVGEATKLELIARLRSEAREPAFSAETTAAVDAFLADSERPVRDRLGVTIALEQTRFAQNPPATRPEALAVRAAQARRVMDAFPDEPEGYGYLLATAKAESPDNARALAEELLASGAPDHLKAGATRVLRRLDLVGQPLQLVGAEVEIAAALGRPLIVYSWSVERPGFLQFMQRLGRTQGLAFIGVNLDPDRAAAEQAVASLELPGRQIYDSGRLEGPAAGQLNLTTTSSLYIVDPQGRVADVNGHRETTTKIGRTLVTEGGEP